MDSYGIAPSINVVRKKHKRNSKILDDLITPEQSKGDFGPAHIHPGCALSVVIYLLVPEYYTVSDDEYLQKRFLKEGSFHLGLYLNIPDRA